MYWGQMMSFLAMLKLVPRRMWLGFVVWGLLALPMVALVITSYLFAPLIALPVFVRVIDGREYLVRWLYWFQTFDNPLDEAYHGNYGLSEWVNRFRGNYATSGLSKYMFRVYWMWRNSVYGFARHPFGVSCTSVSYIYRRGEKDFLAVSDDGGWFTPFQFRGFIFGAYAYVGWKLTADYRDGSSRKMYTIQINPFRKG